jgi:predicted RNase H-like HicB family nuclease
MSMTPKNQTTQTECARCSTQIATLNEIIAQQKEVIELLKERKRFKRLDEPLRKYPLLFPN